MKLRQHLPLMISLAMATGAARGAIVFEHYYNFENAGNLGKDLIGSADFTSVAGLTQGSTSPVAGNYASFSTASAASGANIAVSGGGSFFLVTTVRLDSLTTPYGGPLDFLGTNLAFPGCSCSCAAAGTAPAPKYANREINHHLSIPRNLRRACRGSAEAQRHRVPIAARGAD